MTGGIIGGWSVMAARDLDVRAEVAAGNDIRPRPIGALIGIPPATIYGQIARGEITARRIGRVLVIPNQEARRLLGMEERADPAAAKAACAKRRPAAASAPQPVHRISAATDDGAQAASAPKPASSGLRIRVGPPTAPRRSTKVVPRETAAEVEARARLVAEVLARVEREQRAAERAQGRRQAEVPHPPVGRASP